MTATASRPRAKRQCLRCSAFLATHSGGSSLCSACERNYWLVIDRGRVAVAPRKR